MKPEKLKALVPKILKLTILGTTILSRVLSMFLPSAAPAAIVGPEVWASVGNELGNEIETPILPAEIVDVVNNADLEADLQQALILSFSLARPEDIFPLDEMWIDKIVAFGDSDIMAQFIAMRSTWKFENIDPDDGAFMNWQLWPGQAASGDCDGDAAPTGDRQGRSGSSFAGSGSAGPIR